MLQKPFFDPNRSYEENWEQGPFGAFADGDVDAVCEEPKSTILGRKLCSPFGIPAGPLLNGKFVKAALDKGFDIPMHKTVRTRALRSHPWPNVLSVHVEGDLTLEKAEGELFADDRYDEPLSITNSFGNPSYDPNVWQQDLADAVTHAKPGQLVAGSFEGRDWDGNGREAFVDDWVLGARLLNETGVGLIEMNFSCPNEGTGDLLCFDVAMVSHITQRVRQQIGDTLLAIKMPFFGDAALAEFVQEVGGMVDVLASINTIAATIVDKDGQQALSGEGRAKSGVCGQSIKWAGIDMTKRLKRLREEFDMTYEIIGVGGVMTPKDFQDYRDAGADVVMSATGAMWNPYLAREIKEHH